MKILFGVFEWGLGHATRSKPLISGLLEAGHKVDIVSSGNALKFLKHEFGNKCRYFNIKSMGASPYSRYGFFILRYLLSSPKMLYQLEIARLKVKKLLKKYRYDRIISDCRYDVYDGINNSFLITHQLRLKSPILEGIVGRIIASMANMHYNCVIVPDFPRRQLTGTLSVDHDYKVPINYIGILSHLKKKKVAEDIDYFIPISGPEPQRTVFEEKILRQVGGLKGTVVIAGGKPGNEGKIKKNNIHFHHFLNSKKQADMMNRAKFVISRSGYTTVMDLIELDKKRALFVPTPGQSEQEYLGDLYEKKRLFHHVHQRKMHLWRDVNVDKKFSGFRAPWKTEKSVKKFMEIIEV